VGVLSPRRPPGRQLVSRLAGGGGFTRAALPKLPGRFPWLLHGPFRPFAPASPRCVSGI